VWFLTRVVAQLLDPNEGRNRSNETSKQTGKKGLQLLAGLTTASMYKLRQEQNFSLRFFLSERPEI
jgi:hypothetical protein